MTDLETLIRDALNDRAASVPIRRTALVQRRRRWLAPTLAAALVIALVAITLVLVARKSTTTPPATSTTPPIVGYTWVLRSVVDAQGTLTMPVRTQTAIEFERTGRMNGEDGIHTYNARYRLVPGGYEPSDLSVTGNGLAGPVPAVLKRRMAAIQSCFDSPRDTGKPPALAPVSATVRGNHLTLHTGYGVLTFVHHP